MLLKRLLLPTDFSPRSKGVATYATELAKQFHATLTLAHALPPIQMPWAAMDGAGALLDQVLQNQRDLARKQLDSLLLSELKGLSVTRVLLEGDWKALRCGVWSMTAFR